jgi:hypothetical protein
MSKTPKDIMERAFEFAVRIIKLCQHLDKKSGVPRTLSYHYHQELYSTEGGARMQLLVETPYRRQDHAGKKFG